jgi:hypothetical protein
MKVEKNDSFYIFGYLANGTYHKNLANWILLSSKLGEFGPIFSKKNPLYRSNFGKTLPLKKKQQQHYTQLWIYPISDLFV